MKLRNSLYIENIRRQYALMVLLERAIPGLQDGLKTSARRIMWMARDGKKNKSAALAGATMAIHPHATPETAVNTLAGYYTNNIPLLKGAGDFGTILAPKTYGASRYTGVSISDFAKDAFFVDMEIIPMKPNYDHTQEEPVHFLPLVPIGIVNPSSGIAIGFASDILPRKLSEIIDNQIAYLKGQDIQPLVPYYAKYNNRGIATDDPMRWRFDGKFVRENATTVRITELPPVMLKTALTGTDERDGVLDKLIENGTILDYIDNCTDKVDIVVKFKRGVLSEYTDERLLKMLGIMQFQSENLNLIDLNKEVVLPLTDVDVIKIFTDWRLSWYIARYERLLKLVEIQIRKHLDVLIAIKHEAGRVSNTMRNKAEFKQWLQSIGVNDTEYVSTLPTYRYTQEEKEKLEQTLREAVAEKNNYIEILNSDQKRRDIYISELKAIKKVHG